MDFAILFAVTILAGFIGSIMGLGGGIIMVPLFTIVFALPIKMAVGTSLVAIIINSAASSVIYLERGEVSLPAALRLQTFTVIGATAGGVAAGFFPARLIAYLFSVVLLWTAYQMAYKALRVAKSEIGGDVSHGNQDWDFYGLGRKLRLWAYGGSVFAGMISSLLGVGGGVIQVPLIHLLLKAPIRISIATSAFMIGITASAGAAHYVLRGDINPLTAVVVATSIFVGAHVGATIAPKIRLTYIRVGFSAVLIYTAIRMFIQG